MSDRFEIRPVGTVESPLVDHADAPLQAEKARVTVTAREQTRLCVASLEAINGTPIVDVKTVRDRSA